MIKNIYKYLSTFLLVLIVINTNIGSLTAADSSKTEVLTSNSSQSKTAKKTDELPLILAKFSSSVITAKMVEDFGLLFLILEGKTEKLIHINKQRYAQLFLELIKIFIKEIFINKFFMPNTPQSFFTREISELEKLTKLPQGTIVKKNKRL